MLKIDKVIAQGQGLAQALLKRAPHVELPWDLRQKSRFEAHDSTGQRLGVFVPRGTVLRSADVLVCEDGQLIVVQAAQETVMRVTSCPTHGSPLDLLRAAYHLGNRHVTLEVRTAYLQLEPDHVLQEMLEQMHLMVQTLQAPFEPEGGAYAAAHAHAHSHDHSHDHPHHHAHGHDHTHD